MEKRIHHPDRSSGRVFLLRTLLPAALAALLGATALHAETRDIQLRFLGTAEGLSHQTVNCFCQDEFGFIWIGTQDGLNRFDGHTIDRYKPGASPRSITSNNIRQLIADGRGHIYIRSLQCVERYDLRLDRFEMLYDGEVSAMTCDGERLFIAAGDSVFTLGEPADGAPAPAAKLFSFRGIPGCEQPGVIGNLLVSDDTLTMTTSRCGLVCVVGDSLLYRHPMGAANALMRDDAENVWVCSRDEGLYRFDAAWRATRYRHEPGVEGSLAHDNVRAVAPAGDSLYYVGTFGGLQILDLRTGRFIDCAYDTGLDAFNIRSILTMLYDSHGTLWMGTFHRGVQYYNSVNDIYRFYRSSSGVRGRLASSIVSAITEDGAGNIWFATEGSGLFRFDPATGDFTPFAGRLCSQVIKSLLYEPEYGCLWASTLFHGIDRIDLATGDVRHIPPTVHTSDDRTVGQVPNIVRMISDGERGLLLATNWGLVRLDRRRMRLEAMDNQALFHRRMSQIWDLAHDGEFLWVSTSFDLLKVSVRRDSLRRYTFAEISGTQAKQHVNYILKDHTGTMWFGSTGSGVFRYDPASDSFRGYSQEHGLVNGFVTGLAEQPADSTIYVAHNHGVSRLGASRASFENYDMKSGFPLSGVSDGGLYFSPGAGLFACGLQGVVRIRHDRLRHRHIDYDVYVKEVLADNRPLYPGDSTRLIDATPLYRKHMVLPPAYSSVTFTIANNNYTDISATGMEYRLEGFDADFIRADASPRITYTNLRPGRYRFVVRGMQPDSRGRCPEAAFDLRVQAPVYLRWWFVLLAVLAAGAVAAVLVRLYWRRQKLEQLLEAEQREKEHTERVNQQKFRFFTNVSHEFRTPLTLITGQIELLLMQQDIRPGVYNKILGVYKNARRMNRLVDEIIDIRRQEQDFLRLTVSRDDIVPLAEEISLTMRDYAAIHRIDFRFEAAERPLEVWFDRRQIEKVLYNLLSNAFKYTREGDSIRVAVRRDGDGDGVEIAVADTGIGIAPEHLPHIFERFWQEERANAAADLKGSGIGLSLARGLVEMHGGTLTVESAPGRGSVFRVRLPGEIRRDNPNIIFADRTEPRELFVRQNEADAENPVAADKSVKLLIVEDNSEMLEVLRQIFSPVYDVYTAQDGEAGLEAARRIQPDLVLSDIMMPVLSGLEMCTRLKTGIDTSHIPVVLLTARNTEEHTVEGLLTGADDYITKPFNVRILAARCNNIIVQRRRLQSKFRHAAAGEEPQLTVNPRDRKLLADAAAIVERHLADPDFDVNRFARELGMSRTLLFAKIKGLTGQTPNDFIVSIRLKRALARIAAGEESIASIAYDTGFSSPSYFIRCFRRNFGMTPNAYRKQQGR